MQKLEKFLSEDHRGKKTCTFLGPKHKSTVSDRTAPTYTSNLVYMCAGGLRGDNLQIELNYLDSFNTYCNFSDLGFLGSGGWDRWMGVSGVNNYSLYEFRTV